MKKILFIIAAVLLSVASFAQTNGNFKSVRFTAGLDTATFSPQPNGTLIYGNNGKLLFKTSTYWMEVAQITPGVYPYWKTSGSTTLTDPTIDISTGTLLYTMNDGNFNVTDNGTLGAMTFDLSNAATQQINFYGGRGTMQIGGASHGLYFNLANGYDAKFNDDNLTPKGLQYNADYSAGFATHSLIDQNYLLNTPLVRTASMAQNAGIFNVTNHTTDTTSFINLGTTKADNMWFSMVSHASPMPAGVSLGYGDWSGVTGGNAYTLYQPYSIVSEVSDFGTGKSLTMTANTTSLSINDNSSGSPTSAALSVLSTTHGFLPPVMTTAQRTAISSPGDGLNVYNSTREVPETYDAGGAKWYGQALYLTASQTIDFANTAANTSSDANISVSGATTSDVVIVNSTAIPPNNSTFTAWITASNQVTVRFNNYSTGAIDPASATYYVIVIKNK